eukprot:9445260-Pyramimonas_sp.AAC.1
MARIPRKCPIEGREQSCRERVPTPPRTKYFMMHRLWQRKGVPSTSGARLLYWMLGRMSGRKRRLQTLNLTGMFP